MPEKTPDTTDAKDAAGAAPTALSKLIDQVLALEGAGKPLDAFAAASALAVRHPDRLEMVRLAVDIGLRAGRSDGPENIAMALNTKHPDSAAALYTMCYAQYCRDQFDVAEKGARVLANRFPQNLDVAFLLAQICRKQSNVPGAIACLNAVLPRHPNDARLHQFLAVYYLLDDAPDKAAASAMRAKTLGLQSSANANVLGNALCRTNRHADAVRVLEEADAAEPGNIETISRLSAARNATGDPQGALADVMRALELRPFTVRGPDAEQAADFTALVIEGCNPNFFDRPSFAAYNQYNFPAHIPARAHRMVHAPLTSKTAAWLARSDLRSDIIVNNMVVDESIDQAMRDHYGAFTEPYESVGVPIINRLEAVAECGRQENSEKFADETNFIFPRTRRISTATMPFDSILGEIEDHYTWPVLIRPVQSNFSMGMRLIDGPDALREMVGDMPAGEFFVIQYHECRNENGVGRQCRVAVIGDEAFVERLNCHLAFHSNDKIRFTPEWVEREFDRDEMALIADPDDFLGFAWKDTFAPILARIPLDVYGFDFGITREGRPIVFEINAAMNLFNPRSLEWTPYLADHFRTLNDRIVQYLRARVESAA